MVDLSEIGSSGLKRAGGFVQEEFLPALTGRQGVKVYREMADNEAVIGAMLLAVEKVVLGLDWRFDPSDPDDKVAEEQAEFVDGCLHDMSHSWGATLSDILTMNTFGWEWSEILYKKRVGPDQTDPRRRSKFTDGKVGWRKFAHRNQETLFKWVFDDEGGIQAMVQMDPYNTVGNGEVVIPIDKSLLFRTTTRGGNPEGRSLLRNVYRSWYFKKRIEEIEAIGVERDLAGLPVAYVPPDYLSKNATDDQKAVLAAITDIVQNVKRNEQEGVVFPRIYDENGNLLFLLELLSTGGTRSFDTDKIVSRYDQRMAMALLADWLLLGHEQVGSKSLGVSKMDLWSMIVDAIASSIAEVINQNAIPRLLKLNGMDLTKAPTLTYGEVSHVDLAALADYVDKLVSAGAIMPDPDLEEFLRETANLPPAEDRIELADRVDLGSSDEQDDEDASVSTPTKGDKKPGPQDATATDVSEDPADTGA